MRAKILALAAPLLAGCVYATKVTSGGREAFRIHCQSEPQCVDKAGEVCAGAYDVLTSKVEADGFVNNGTGYANSPIEIVVACRGTAPSGVASARGAPSAGPASTAAPPETPDASACMAANTTLKETAAFWSGLRPEAKRLDELPSARDFGEVCRALPERVQRCLDARYREAHDKPCLALLRRLEPSERNKLDSLFLE